MQVTGLEHGHPIADRHRLLGVMGDDHPAGAATGEDAGELSAQAQAHLDVQVGEGLIQQHQGAARGQGAGQGQPLALTAGEFVGIAALEALQAEQLQQPGRTAGVLAALEAKAGVAPGIEVGEEGVVLKDHAHPAALGRQPAPLARHGPAANRNGTALGLLEASDQAQQGGLATARGAKQPHQLAGLELEIDVPQRPVPAGGGTGVAMPEATELHLRLLGEIRGGHLSGHSAGSP